MAEERAHTPVGSNTAGAAGIQGEAAGNRERVHAANHEKLVRIFAAGGKQHQGIGIELEHLLLHKNTGAPVAYEGPDGVGELLRRLSVYYERGLYDQGNLVGLVRGDQVVSLEPGLQLELSAGPYETVMEVERVYLSFREELDRILEDIGLMTPMLGYTPSALAEEAPHIRNFRYACMQRFLGAQAPEGVEMMHCSSSLQVNIDYTDEADAMRKFRVAQALSPLLALMTDNSPIYRKKPRTGNIVRTCIWGAMNQDRVDTVPGSFAPGFGFDGYADYILSRQAILVPNAPGIRVPHDADAPVDPEGKWVWAGDATFDDIYQRPMTDQEAEHALTMVWPDVRLRGYLEIRPGDAMPFDYVLSFTALIKNLFYNQANLDVLETLTAGVDEDDINAAKRELERKGYAGTVYGRPMSFWANVLTQLAFSVSQGEERIYFEPLMSMAKYEFTLADAYKDPAKRDASYREALDALPADSYAPRIGILPRYDFESTGISLSTGYTSGVLAAGGLPLVLPITDDPGTLRRFIHACDGFIVPGGSDIDPEFYGQKRDMHLHRVIRQRDEMEIALIPAILAAEKPLLGICRGMQALNVARGGTLFQDIHSSIAGEHIQHVQARPFDRPVHDVDIDPDSKLAHIMGTVHCRVNTMHHQSIAQAGKGVRVVAKAPDGVTEAIEMPDADFVVGVQWHPEFLWPAHAEEKRLFQGLVDAAARRRKRDAALEGNATPSDPGSR